VEAPSPGKFDRWIDSVFLEEVYHGKGRDPRVLKLRFGVHVDYHVPALAKLVKVRLRRQLHRLGPPFDRAVEGYHSLPDPFYHIVRVKQRVRPLGERVLARGPADLPVPGDLEYRLLYARL
jgi:hypothetical protein